MSRTIAPVPPLLPRFTASLLKIEDERRVAKAILEAGEGVPVNGRAGATSGGDPRRLRGLPAIGRNVSGAMQDSDPLRALLRKEARGELRR